MALTNRLEAAIEQHGLWQKESKLLIAVSGGVDSVSLLHAISNLPKEYQADKIGVAHINHQTRPETQEEEVAVRKLAQDLACPVHVKQWSEGGQVKRNFEQAARNMRYNFFHKVMVDHAYTHLVTAHHLDDQAETILMRLIRGGLLADKQGISFKRDFHGFKLVRPLLATPKSDLYDYAAAHNLTYFEDATNYENHHLRNRIRNQVLPLLNQENPQASHHLQAFSEDLTDLLALAQPKIERVKKQLISERDTGLELSVSALLEQSPAMQRLVLQSILKDVFSEIGAFKKEYINLILDWLPGSSPNSQLDLSDDWTCVRSYDRLIISQGEDSMTGSPDQTHRFKIRLNQWTTLNETEIIGLFEASHLNLQPGDLKIAIPKSSTSGPFTVRHRKNGDKMTYKGGQGHKKIKDILINQKVPAKDRNQAWVIEDGRGEILWLVGYQEPQLSNSVITDKINYIFVYRQIAMED